MVYIRCAAIGEAAFFFFSLTLFLQIYRVSISQGLAGSDGLCFEHVSRAA